MTKEKKELKKKGVEEEVSEVKETKKTSKSEKSEKQIRKEEILKEKKKIEGRIDALSKDKKATKDKDSKKKIQKEINKLKLERKQIGKKDTFFGDLKKEMSMVRWPKANEMVKYTVACLVFVLFFALFFFGIDALFALVKDLID